MFDVDWQGARAIAAAAPEDTVRVFILPPSMAEMVRRIHARAGDSDEMIRRRLETAPRGVHQVGRIRLRHRQ